MNIPKEFAQLLQSHREALGLSQRQLANKAGVNSTFVSLLERGDRQPTLTTLFKLSEALGISPAELISKLEKATKFKVK